MDGQTEAVEHIHGELAQRVWDLQMARLKREAIPALERAAKKLEQAEDEIEKLRERVSIMEAA